MTIPMGRFDDEDGDVLLRRMHGDDDDEDTDGRFDGEGDDVADDNALQAIHTNLRPTHVRLTLQCPMRVRPFRTTPHAHPIPDCTR